MKVLSFGEILWDVYPDKKCLGGAPLNFAAHLAKHGGEVYILSALGDDELGKETLKQVESLGVSTRFINIDPEHQTGQCLVSLDDQMVPTYNLLSDVAYDYILSDSVNERFDVLYFGTLALRSKTNFDSLKRLITEGCAEQIFVDINIRAPFYDEDSVLFAVRNANIIKISAEELGVVAQMLGIGYSDYKDFARALAERFANLICVIITCGEDGAYALDCMECCDYFAPSQKVEVKSTVGAGDSFSAAFLSMYMSGRPMSEALDYAGRVAAFVVSQYAAIPDYNFEDLI